MIRSEPWYKVGLAPTKETLYVHRPLVNVEEFQAWAKDRGFSHLTDSKDLHTTILYSKAPVSWSIFTPAKNQLRVVGGSRKVEALGDEGAVVLRFDSLDLQSRHREFIEGGGSHDYESYLPHVTITYDAGDVDLSEVEPYTGPLVFGPEEFAPIDTEWKPEKEAWCVEAASPIDRLKVELGRDPGNADLWIQLLVAYQRQGQLLKFADYLWKHQPYSNTLGTVFEYVEKKPRKTVEELAFLWKVSETSYDAEVTGYPNLTQEELYRSPVEYLPTMYLECVMTNPNEVYGEKRELKLPLKTFVTQARADLESPAFLKELDPEVQDWLQPDSGDPLVWVGFKNAPEPPPGLDDVEAADYQTEHETQVVVRPNFATRTDFHGNPQGWDLVLKWLGKKQ